MSWSFENHQKWAIFQELESEVWRTQDMGSAAYREIWALMPSDSGAHIPECDRYNARKMLVHAESVLRCITGIDRNGRPIN